MGPRALSLSSVAKRAFVSTGAVYERWPSREACIGDLISSCTPDAIETVCGDWADPRLTIQDIVAFELRDPDRLQSLRFLAEVVFAARDEPSFGPQVRGHLASWESAISARVPGAHRNPAISWWVMCTWLGTALLRTSECAIPASFDDHVATILTTVDAFAESPPPPLPAAAHLPEHPLPVGDPVEGDQTATALVEATHQLISERGVLEADLRSVAREAGVTTGAVYRRFSSRSELMIRAFIAGLGPERYAWTPDFLAVLDRDGLEGAGEYWASLCQRIWQDEAQAHLLLEFTVAAHTDDQVLASVLREISSVAANREFLFSSLIDAGIVNAGHPPDGLAWTLQIPPVGMRLLASIGMVPTSEELVPLMRGYLLYLMSEG